MSINDFPSKLTDGYFHVLVGDDEVAKYKTKKNAITKCDSVNGIITLDDCSVVYPAEENAVAEDPAEDPEETKMYGIVQTRLNVREGRSLAAKIVAILKKGDAITITNDYGDWYKIQSSDDAPMFVKSNYVKTGKNIYVIKAGDTWGKIEEDTGVSAESIKEYNHVSSLKTGAALLLP